MDSYIKHKAKDGTVQKVTFEEMAQISIDEQQFAELKKEIVEENRREIDRRLRAYVWASVQSKFQPGSKALRKKCRIAYSDLWAYIIPILEG